jgi:predicted deacylase
MGGQDPNRLFPAPQAKRGSVSVDSPPSIMEAAYKTLFEHIQISASYLIDLHNYSIGALSFAFRDPVYYRNGRDKLAAQQLQTTTGEMLAAFGHTIINEFASSEYLKLNLHRSVSGATLNAGRIPAFTAELGGYMTVDADIVKAAITGIHNIMRWAKMLDGPMEAIIGIRVIAPGYPMRRTQHPFAPNSGIVSYFVKAGDLVTIGDSIARITDIYGRPLGADDGLVCSDYDGIVLGVVHGAVCYRNEPLLSLAVRDDGELLLPFPA